MSAGPGRLQSLVLKTLSEKPSWLFRELLWKIAELRCAVSRTEKRGEFIEEGIISKSFTENFRRAIANLDGSVQKNYRKFTDVTEVLTYNQYLTSRLEIYELRKILKCSLLNYIEQELPPNKRMLDFEEYAVTSLSNSNVEEYKKLMTQWYLIERAIVEVLQHVSHDGFDVWIDLLMRGRKLFGLRTQVVESPLFQLRDLAKRTSNTSDCYVSKALVLLDELLSELRSSDSWRMGCIKNSLYQFFDAPRGRKVRISNQCKNYLYTTNKDIIESLPGHKGVIEQVYTPEKSHMLKILARKVKYYEQPIEYSDWLNKLFDRSIFKKHTFLSLAA